MLSITSINKSSPRIVLCSIMLGGTTDHLVCKANVLPTPSPMRGSYDSSAAACTNLRVIFRRECTAACYDRLLRPLIFSHHSKHDPPMQTLYTI